MRNRSDETDPDATRRRLALPVPVTAMLLVAAGVLAACGEEEEPARENRVPAQAADAIERNEFELDGIRYRIVSFRQINPRVRADDALYDGRPESDDAGVFAAFIRACNVAEEPRKPTSDIGLEDAFGNGYPRLEEASSRPFDYRPRPIEPGGCIPTRGGVTDRAYPGAVLLFEVPFERLSNRPFVLEFQDAAAEGDGTVRVELDL